MTNLTLGEEYEEKMQLEEQKKAAEEKYRYKRRQIKEIQEDMQARFLWKYIKYLLLIKRCYYSPELQSQFFWLIWKPTSLSPVTSAAA